MRPDAPSTRGFAATTAARNAAIAVAASQKLDVEEAV